MNHFSNWMHWEKIVLLLQEPIIVFDYHKSLYKLQVDSFRRIYDHK